MKNRKSAIFPVFVTVTFFTIITAGIAGTVLPSFNYMPVIGAAGLSIAPWIDFFLYPGIKSSVFATVFSGFTSTIISVILTFLFLSFCYKSRIWKLFERILSPVLSVPHAAFAVGFGFLIAPSGWIIRLISPGLTGFQVPPDWILLNDPLGAALTVSLVIKEFPFLVMVSMGVIGRLDTDNMIQAGRSLGYKKEQVWLKIIIPALYPHLRLSVFAVIAYSLSVADMAVILGPTSPPTLAVMILNWFNDPDVNLKLLASAGSLFLLLISGLSILLLFGVEKSALHISRRRIINGKRKTKLSRFKGIVIMLSAGSLLVAGVIIMILCLWSLAWRWSFPDSLPERWSLLFWKSGFLESLKPLSTSLSTGLLSAAAGLVLVIGCMEHEILPGENKKYNLNRYIKYFIYLPLLIPQVTFVSGIQLLLVMLNLDGYRIALIWSHLLFVLPYIYITLSATYRSFDKRISDQAVILRKSYISSLLRVKIPILLKPVLFSFAIGFSVSIAQYIPTLLIGAGRFTTITTELVSISSGSDRRVTAVFAMIQFFMPLIIYLLAVILPKIFYYNRKGMQV